MMQRCFPLLFSLFFVTSPLIGYMVGNFSDPKIYQEGISCLSTKHVHFRAGYFADYLYRLELRDEFITPDSDSTDLQMTTYAALLNLNLCHRIDLYTILGSTKMDEDELGFVPRKFSWSLGAKTLLLQWGKFCFSIDGKYFQTKQKPCYYLLEDGEPAFVLNNLDFTYTETQVAFGFGYRFSFFSTYLGATYLDAKLEPNTRFIALKIPAFGRDAIYSDDGLKNNVNQHQFGIVWGISLISSNTISLNVESRHIDQNDVNVYGVIRF
ncbi:MAG: hypothetical protein AAGI90_04885 [Chlamydiota bacterium]